MKELIKKIPLFGFILTKLMRWVKGQSGFVGSQKYWELRYASGGNSGPGSYGRLAHFKADVINSFVINKEVASVIEFGCGDGNQLGLALYRCYTGLDVSLSAIEICKRKFESDSTKTFLHYKPAKREIASLKADLALSLDVIYHLVENRVFEIYMRDLFQSADRYVILYTSNTDSMQNHHERPRDITTWIKNFMKGWTLIEIIRNPYPYEAQNPANTSNSDFFIYGKSTDNH